MVKIINSESLRISLLSVPSNLDTLRATEGNAGRGILFCVFRARRGCEGEKHTNPHGRNTMGDTKLPDNYS